MELHDGEIDSRIHQSRYVFYLSFRLYRFLRDIVCLVEEIVFQRSFSGFSVLFYALFWVYRSSVELSE